ncbi:MAG: 3-carboxymuconate cyclase [Verrucomicrobiales bacterium]|nr:3-carboxymuconate cyclase [Verrucomicrobiales bacterium]
MKIHLALALSILSPLLVGTTYASSIPLWIGTGGKNAKGIYKATFDSKNGTLTSPVLAAEVEGPGWVTLNSKKDRLYAVCKIGEPRVAVWSISGDGKLSLINSQPIGDGGAAHVCLDMEDRILFTAQYGGGSTAAFALSKDGSIGKRTALIEHKGSGPNEQRQKSPHPHWTGVSPDNRFLFVPDLGNDRIEIYKIDHENQTIEDHGFGQTVPGGGPRHMKFGSDGSKVYLLNELLLSVTVFDYDAKDGKLRPIQTIENIPPEEIEIPSKSSEIRVHPSGKFVYAANRGPDNITVFAVDNSTGKLSFVENEAIRGAWPRNFNLSPDGKWLIAAGRYSNTLSLFEIDQETGGLIFTGKVENCPSPICITH